MKSKGNDLSFDMLANSTMSEKDLKDVREHIQEVYRIVTEHMHNPTSLTIITNETSHLLGMIIAIMCGPGGKGGIPDLIQYVSGIIELDALTAYNALMALNDVADKGDKEGKSNIA